MSKKLVIVESPSKSKTIEKYLGSDYVVTSSKGHVRDLATSGTLSSIEGLTSKRRQLFFTFGKSM